MNGLVGYGSGSEGEDEPAPPAASTTSQASSTTPLWKACLDKTSGHSYYWNTRTNEVTWSRPAAYVPPQVTPSQPPAQKRAAKVTPITSFESNSPKPKTKRGSTKGTIVYGPALPAEVIAREKIKKFEEQVAAHVLRDIERENPPDWVQGMPRSLHPRPFSWHKKEPTLAPWQILSETKAANSMALIAGSYADDSNEESGHSGGETTSPPKGSRKRKMPIKVKVKSSSAKTPKTQLKPVLEVFQEKSSSDEAHGDGADPRPEEKPAESVVQKAPKEVQRDERGRRIYESSNGASYKKSIDDVAEVLCDKLEALNVASISISPLKLLAIRVETLFQAWQIGALTGGYMQKILGELSQEMLTIEAQDLVPAGWKALWNR
eukprot:snap_masked-scaffold232_size243569-processed-gene-0.1 protein:Tk07013 transcript:snap_masked-scaffold232_size243569-processed-gene-0.1-mRNA-1 annotation:"unnamed protein product"